jgi:hypothetical protein
MEFHDFKLQVHSPIFPLVRGSEQSRRWDFEPNLWYLDGMQSCVFPRADTPAPSPAFSLAPRSFHFARPLEQPVLPLRPGDNFCADSTYRC